MSEARPFRFGVTTSTAKSRLEWIDKARMIEALGYSTLTVPDHFLERLAIVPALISAADATETLRVASWVFCNDFRHPALLYREAATLDLLSDGRFELGIGAGWLKGEYDMTGIPFDAASVRVARMEEAVRVIKGLAAEGPFDFAGDHYRISGLEGAPKPVQRPLPPLYIGGGGKRLLSFAAQEADIVGFGAKALPNGGLDSMDITAEAVRRKRRWVQVATAKAPHELEINILIFIFEITDDRQCAAQRRADELPGMSAADILGSPHALIGTPEQMAEDLRQRREEYGISYIVLNTTVDEHIDLFGRVVALLAGR